LPDCGGRRTERQLVILYWREGLKLFSRHPFSGHHRGLALNTIFLVREIRRNEQHDSFINAVTMN